MDDLGDELRPRAFLTCAARACKVLAPLLDEAEGRLLDAGWRTRRPRRVPPREGTPLEDRRRLRLDSYHDVERASLLIHAPAPSSLSGLKLHRELQCAVRAGVPVVLLACRVDRERMGIGPPEAARLAELVRVTGGTVVDDLSQLGAVAHRLHALRAEGALPR